jgi:hypothetical protein
MAGATVLASRRGVARAHPSRAIVFSIANALVLNVRIRAVDTALGIRLTDHGGTLPSHTVVRRETIADAVGAAHREQPHP